MLNQTLLSKLESFQVEIGKRRSLQISFLFSMVLNWPSMRARILCAKLAFLTRISSLDNDSFSSRVFRTLLSSDVDCVKQCRFLELPFGSNFTDQALLITEQCSIRELKEKIVQADKQYAMSHAVDHQSLKFVSQVYSWMRVWDFALDFGEDGTTATHCL